VPTGAEQIHSILTYHYRHEVEGRNLIINCVVCALVQNGSHFNTPSLYMSTTTGWC